MALTTGLHYQGENTREKSDDTSTFCSHSIPHFLVVSVYITRPVLDVQLPCHFLQWEAAHVLNQTIRYFCGR